MELAGPARKPITIATLLWRCVRPQDALIFFRYRTQTLVNELLQSLPTIGFGSVDVAFRIGGDTMYGIELPRLSSAVAETRQNLECVAQ